MLKHRFIRTSPAKASFSSYVSSSEECISNDENNDLLELNNKNNIFPKRNGNNEPIFRSPLRKSNSLSNVSINSNNLRNNLKGFEKNRSVEKDISKTSRALNMLEELRKGNNLEKFLESHGLHTSGVSIPHLKAAFDQYLSRQTAAKKKEISKWEQQVNNLKELTNDKNLEKWLESVGVAGSNVSLPLVKEELKRFFNEKSSPQKNIAHSTLVEPLWGKRLDEKDNKSLDFSDESEKSENEDDDDWVKVASESTFSLESNTISSNTIDKPVVTTKTRVKRSYGPSEPLHQFKGRSLIYQENTLAKKLWDDFKGMNATKQVGIVIALTITVGALGFVSWRILLLAFPGVFQMNMYWGEVLAQWFISRQDSAFYLFQHTADTAKPLSTAWVLESDVHEELLINLPFKNRPHMTFRETFEHADYEFKLIRDASGFREYLLKADTFPWIKNLSIHIPSNFGNGTTRICYIGLRGEFKALRLEILINSELQPNLADYPNRIWEQASHKSQMNL